MTDHTGQALVLHHVGFVVRSIADSIQGFVSPLGGQWDGNIVHDPLQKVRVTFLQVGTGASIELIEPAAEDSPVNGFLEKAGGGLHHMCYQVARLDEQLKWMRSRGVMIARPPMPAAAFNGRRIAWVFTRQRLLVELLEMDGDK